MLRTIAELVGIKTFLNEFVAYLRLSTLINNRHVLESYNGTVVEIGDDLFLSRSNTTLVGGVLTVSHPETVCSGLCHPFNGCHCMYVPMYLLMCVTLVELEWLHDSRA